MPGPPSIVSVPKPPSSTSLPDPPKMVSSPRLVRILSSPARPWTRSLSSSPLKMTMSFDKSFPVMSVDPPHAMLTFSIPLRRSTPRTLDADPAARLTTISPGLPPTIANTESSPSPPPRKSFLCDDSSLSLPVPPRRASSFGPPNRSRSHDRHTCDLRHAAAKAVSAATRADDVGAAVSTHSVITTQGDDHVRAGSSPQASEPEVPTNVADVLGTRPTPPRPTPPGRRRSSHQHNRDTPAATRPP